MNHSHIVRPTFYHPAASADAAGRATAHKWPLKHTFIFVVTASAALWAAVFLAVWHLA